jgi:hypothetical protein
MTIPTDEPFRGVLDARAVRFLAALGPPPGDLDGLFDYCEAVHDEGVLIGQSAPSSDPVDALTRLQGAAVMAFGKMCELRHATESAERRDR